MSIYTKRDWPLIFLMKLIFSSRLLILLLIGYGCISDDRYCYCWWQTRFFFDFSSVIDVKISATISWLCFNITDACNVYLEIWQPLCLLWILLHYHSYHINKFLLWFEFFFRSDYSYSANCANVNCATILIVLQFQLCYNCNCATIRILCYNASVV